MENIQDSILKIHTTGRDDSMSDLTNFPYEATPYSVLERLAYSGYISKKNTLIDYGCGKGRVDFYLSFMTKCKSIGIEYSDILYSRAIQNQKTASRGARCTFIHIDAKDYSIPNDADVFYFFNPFSVEVLQVVLENIMLHVKKNNEVVLVFYYISSKYLEYISTIKEIELQEEIDCSDCFKKYDPKEKLSIYKMKKSA